MPIVQSKLLFTTLMFFCPILTMFIYILNMKLDFRDLKIEYLTYQLTTVLQLPGTVPEHVDNTAENYIRNTCDKVILTVLSVCILMIVRCIEFAEKGRCCGKTRTSFCGESVINGQWCYRTADTSI